MFVVVRRDRCGCRVFGLLGGVLDCEGARRMPDMIFAKCQGDVLGEG